MYKIIRVNKESTAYIENVVAIELATFQDYWNKNHISAEFSSQHSFSYLLTSNNKLIGYIFSTKVFDEIQLNKFCIDQLYRNKKYGRFLLNFFIKEAKNEGVEHILLEVNEQNRAAVELYTSIGFKTIRKRSKIYSNTYDGLEMLLRVELYTESPFTFSIEQLP